MDIKNNKGWTLIKTVSDIPDPKDWDRFEWQIYFDNKWNKISGRDSAGFVVTPAGVINGINGFKYRYRERQVPSDEWIEKRLWWCKQHNCWKSAERDPFGYWEFNDHAVHKSWFLTAQWVLKDTKEGYQE